MSCPICGANCVCKKRGPDGQCCSCHRHKVKRLLISPSMARERGLGGSYAQHIAWVKPEPENQQRDLAEAEAEVKEP